MSEQEKRKSKVIVSDRISTLPDSLLHHILSFLPTQEVVATCLLSKRWRTLWHSMRTFDFEGTGISNLDFFVQFVDAVLLIADSKPIKFRLMCPIFSVREKGKKTEYKRVSHTKVNIWIMTAIKRKVEHFELSSDYNEHIVVPLSIFDISTIRVLKLDGVTVNFPPSIKLPSLKVMHLVEVKLPEYECLAKLLSGCALLEELVLDPHDDDDGEGEDEEKDFTWNIEKLEHLVSATVPSFLITSKALTNVTRLQLLVVKSHVRDTPIFDKLTHLEISSIAYECLIWVMECLRSCPKLEIMMINQVYDDGDGDGDGEGALKEPTKDVPQCLLSHLKEFTLRDYSGCKWECEIVRYIMEKSRVLRTISIHCAYTYTDTVEKYKNLVMLTSCPRGSEHCRLLFN